MIQVGGIQELIFQIAKSGQILREKKKNFWVICFGFDPGSAAFFLLAGVLRFWCLRSSGPRLTWVGTSGGFTVHVLLPSVLTVQRD